MRIGAGGGYRREFRQMYQGSAFAFANSPSAATRPPFHDPFPAKRRTAKAVDMLPEADGRGTLAASSVYLCSEKTSFAGNRIPSLRLHLSKSQQYLLLLFHRFGALADDGAPIAIYTDLQTDTSKVRSYQAQGTHAFAPEHSCCGMSTAREPDMNGRGFITMSMREVDRLRAIQSVVDGRLMPWRAAERLGLGRLSADLRRRR